jgi:putative transposase
MLVPLNPNQCSRLDFVSDQLIDCRRFRILSVVNDCAHKWPGLIADASLSGLRMACEPHHIIAQRASPKMIVSDNATAFTSNVILK